MGRAGTPPWADRRLGQPGAGDPDTDLAPLEIFVHRNIAKVFSPTDLNCLVLDVRAALHSLGMPGVALMGLFCAAAVWLFADWGWLEPRQPRALAWILLVSLGLMRGVGLPWSILRRRLAGQVDVETGPDR